jgi:hypothetical protein
MGFWVTLSVREKYEEEEEDAESIFVWQWLNAVNNSLYSTHIYKRKW